MMSTHKITAGHGYTYLTAQVAAQDASAVPPGGLAAYYAERGEAPGQWLGRGLAGVGLAGGTVVREDQMIALFGEGRHPDAARIADQLKAEGAGENVIATATALGTPFELNLANNEYLRQVAQLMTEWNRANGQPACMPIPPYAKAPIKTAVAQSLFARQHGREAVGARELSDFVASQSRMGSKAVAGFDLTFSPVKSVSALWALAPSPAAAQVEAAHHAAVADTIAWLERTATFTRLGRNGIRQVDTRGLVAAAFVHRTSRAGDPDLHTHVAISNKVQTLDGRWRALDGRVLLKATVAASERYNTRLEAELRERLGLRFAETPRPGRRPVREIDGMDGRLLAGWSSRRAAIELRLGDLATAFQETHGRPPTPVESIELAQQATMDTRPRKHQPSSEAEQRRRWRAEAEQLIGTPRLAAMVDRALAPSRHGSQAFDPRASAQRVIERVQADRATWQRWHVIAEAQRELRRFSVPVSWLEPALDDIVSVALGEYSIALTRPDVAGEPSAVLRADGSSIYSVAGSQLFTSSSVLDAERALLDAARMFDGHRVRESSIDLALLESSANELVLNDGQVRFVRDLATSGARCQLALAPAGTGKTTALRVLARAWVEDGGYVLALAPSAAAARVLGDATGARADTLAKALHDLRSGELQLTSDALLIVDEAGMASTADLAQLLEHTVDAGASLRLVGDDRQLAAVGAGGVLRDIAETVGAATLVAAVRFDDPAEAAATLGVRDGRTDSLDFYLDARRVHVGDSHTAATSAYDAWAADRAAGFESLLLAATRDQVTELNRRARLDRLRSSGDRPEREVPLADGTALSAGDVIVTRRNERRIGITATDWVKNGDRWTVRTLHPGGSLTAVHRATGRHVVLPASYVAADVALGYATTIHGAQGSTADTCHTVITGSETREQLYVALTRGRLGNHVHVALPDARDEHAAARPFTYDPPAAIDLLHNVLDREDAARSATTEIRAHVQPARQVSAAVASYVDSLGLAPTAGGAPPARPAPLPWLPPVPRCIDGGWQTYLDARAEQIAVLADAVTREVLAARNRGALLNRMDPTLGPLLELWHATHHDDDVLSPREQLYLRHLEDRRAALHSMPIGDDAERWKRLVAAVDLNATQAPEYPRLADALTRAFDQHVDVDRLLPRLLAGNSSSTAVEHLEQLIKNAQEERPARKDVEPQLRTLPSIADVNNPLPTLSHDAPSL